MQQWSKKISIFPTGMLIVFATCDMPHASDDSVLAPSIPGCPRTAIPTRVCD